MASVSTARAGRFLGLSEAGFHGVSYLEWGPATADRVILCVHGLTRNARDFEFLAEALSQSARVIAVDVVGRGGSDWLADPNGYAYRQYVADMTALIARLNVPRLDWIGTSMGGLIGMMIAASANSPIERLILNDIGPFIPKAALQRIADYLGIENKFSTIGAVEQYLRKVHAPFGALTDAQWSHLAKYGHRPGSDGSLALNYDPRISENVLKSVEDIDLWWLWDKIRCPTLVLRGVDSDLLLPETLDQMRKRGPGADTIEFPGVGHAPSLMAENQISAIRDWLKLER